MTNQALFPKMALKEKGQPRRWEPRILTGQTAPAKVVKKSDDVVGQYCRYHVTDHLQDQALLASIVKENGQPRRWEPGKLTGKTAPAKVVKKVGDVAGQYCRSHVTDPLQDQALLARIANDDVSPSVREVAVRLMVDQTELARIAAEDRDETVRRAAAECLTDRGPLAIFDDQGRGVTELARIAAEDRDETVRGAAAECSTDRGPLATVDDQGPGVEARCRATNSIDDQAQLAKIAADDEHWQVRSVATKRLTDREELARVAVDDKDERVQQMARGRLADFARKDEEDFEQFCQTAFRLVNCPPSEPLVESNAGA